MGVGQLRRFLEQLLQKRYLENVPSIVPLLEREYRAAAARITSTTVSPTNACPCTAPKHANGHHLIPANGKSAMTPEVWWCCRMSWIT